MIPLGAKVKTDQGNIGIVVEWRDLDWINERLEQKVDRSFLPVIRSHYHTEYTILIEQIGETHVFEDANRWEMEVLSKLEQ